MSALDANQVKLARALVDPEKSVRDETCASLEGLVRNTRAMSEMEMLKFWKALYYCLWLADKAEIQSELAMFICRLIPLFSTEELMVQSIRLFYRTVLREWAYLDQYRVDKFYKIVRYMLRSNLSYLHERKWPKVLTSAILQCLLEEILMKTPNGIRFHIADIYLEELHTATEGSINTTDFMTCIEPFFKCIASNTDSVFRERVQQGVFSNFLEKYARELVSRKDISESDLNELKPFKNVDTKQLQLSLFELASGDNIKEGNRKRVYALHAKFQPVTGEAFVDASMLSSVEEAAASDSKATTTKKSKAAKAGKGSSDVVSAAALAPALAPTPAPTPVPIPVEKVTNEKTSNKKRKSESAVEASCDVAAAVPEEAPAKAIGKKRKETAMEDKSSTIPQGPAAGDSPKSSKKNKKSAEIAVPASPSASGTAIAPVVEEAAASGKKKPAKKAPTKKEIAAVADEDSLEAKKKVRFAKKLELGPTVTGSGGGKRGALKK